jgi:cell division protein FtsB
MAPSPPGPGRQFWREVEQQVAAGLILAAVAGIGFLVWTLPRQLDAILANQKTIAERAAQLDVRMGKAEQQIDSIDSRVTTLEAR